MQNRISLVAFALVASFGIHAADVPKLTAAAKVFELSTKITDGARTVVSYTEGVESNEVVVGVPVEVALHNSCVSLTGQFDTLVRVRPNVYTHHVRLLGSNDVTKGACATVISLHKTLVTVSLTLPKKPVNNTVYYRDVLVGNTWVRASYKHVVAPEPKPEPAPAPAPVPAPAPKPEKM